MLNLRGDLSEYGEGSVKDAVLVLNYEVCVVANRYCCYVVGYRSIKLSSLLCSKVNAHGFRYRTCDVRADLGLEEEPLGGVWI